MDHPKSFVPIFVNCFLFGQLSPLSRTGKPTKLQTCAKILFVLHLLLLSCSYFFGLTSLIPNGSSLIDYLVYFSILMDYCGDIFIHCLCFLFREKINQIFFTFKEVDAALLDLSIQINHELIKKRNISIIVFNLTLCFSQIVGAFFSWDPIYYKSESCTKFFSKCFTTSPCAFSSTGL